MTLIRTMTLTVATALLLGACGKSERSTESTTTAPPVAVAAATDAAAATTAAAAAAAPVAGSAVAALPTPEDYEANAAKTVTADSLTAQLDALEKEIAATPK